MHRLLIALVASAAVILGLVSAPAHAEEGLSALVYTDNTLNTQWMRVTTYTDRPAEAITVRLSVGEQAPYMTLDGFTLVSTGDSADRTVQSWERAGPIRLEFNSNAAVSAVFAGGGSAEASVKSRPLKATTKFTEFEVSSTTVDASHGPVRFQGRLVYLDADGAEHPVPGLLLQVPLGEVLGEVRTDADGRFSGAAYIHSSYKFWVQHRGETASPYRAAASSRVPITVNGVAPTRLSLNVTPETLFPGDTAIATGRLEWQREGEWLPLRSQEVRVHCGDAVVWARTLADGTYRTEFPVTEWCIFWAEFVPGENDGFDHTGDSSPTTAKVYVRTGFKDVSAWSKRVVRDSTFTMSGRVLAAEKPSDVPLGYSVNVWMEFSADGKNWELADHSASDGQSRFEVTSFVTDSGYWRIRVSEMAEYHLPPRILGPVYVQAMDQTRFTGFNASPEPVRKGHALTVKGRLDRRTPGGPWTVFGGRKVAVFFRAKGTKTWREVGTATTDRKGYFSKNFKAAKDGYWRVSFAGGPKYVAATSSADYVDVR